MKISIVHKFILTVIAILLSLSIVAVSGCSQVSYVHEIVYEVDNNELSQYQDQDEVMKYTVEVVERRIDALGIDGKVRQKGQNQIVVHLPEIEEYERVKTLIGSSAIISFKEFQANPNGNFSLSTDTDNDTTLVPVEDGTGEYIAIPAVADIDGEEKELTSVYITGRVNFWYSYGLNKVPKVEFRFNNEGTDLFSQIISRLHARPENAMERRLGVFYGDSLIWAPYVQERVSELGVIMGLEDNEMKELADILNAGRMFVKLHIIAENSID
ncbi:hypothetical protein ACFLU3_05725 [Chloroflexota bacterium]